MADQRAHQVLDVDRGAFLDHQPELTTGCEGIASTDRHKGTEPCGWVEGGDGRGAWVSCVAMSATLLSEQAAGVGKDQLNVAVVLRKVTFLEERQLGLKICEA